MSGLAGVIIATMAAVVLPEAWQQKPSPSSSERAQDQPFPPGSPFALLPGFKIDRVTPPEKTESYIVVTFDPQGRPVVSQSSSGNGSSPRVLLDENRDGIFEGEKIVASQLNTCHGLFYASRTTLFANCRGEVPGDPPLPPAAQFGGRGQPPQPGAGGQAPLGGRGGQSGTGGRHARLLQARRHEWRRRDGYDRANPALRRTGWAITVRTRSGGRPTVRSCCSSATTPTLARRSRRTADRRRRGQSSPNWNNVEERQFLPQFNDPRFGNSTRIGVHATVWRLQENNKYNLFFSGMRNPYDFAFNLAGEAFTFDSDMEWDVNAPWYGRSTRCT